MKTLLFCFVFTLFIGNLPAQFNFVSSYTATIGRHGITSADFDKDGKYDLAVLNSTNQVEVLSGNGAGNFSLAHTLPVGTGPFGLCTADLNSDTKPDIITANYNSNDISVLLSATGSGFQPAVNYPTGPTPQSVAAADFNGDGKVDVACGDWGSNTIRIFSGNGTGLLGLAGTYTAAAGPICIKAVDVNKDNKPDLISANSWAFNLSVLINDGAGGFLAATSYTLPFNAYGVDLGDLDTDGNLDIVTFVYSMSNTNQDRLFVLKGNSNGTFQPCVGYNAGGTTGLIADFDADSKPDVATIVNSGSSTLLLFKGNGDASFTPATFVAGNFSSSAAVCSGDFDNDGKADLACVNENSSNLEVFLNRTGPTGPVGLKEETTGQELFQLYPNPSSGEFFLSSREEMKISVTNGLGVFVYHSEAALSGQVRLSLSDLPAGVYVVTGKTRDRIETKKIMILL